MSKYTVIKLSEIMEVLDATKGWKIVDVDANTKEYIFEFPLTSRPHIVVRVCSSIHKESNASRKVGKDAIRVFAVNNKTGKGWISTTRVYRVEGWRDNLKKTVMKVFTEAKNRKEF